MITSTENLVNIFQIFNQSGPECVIYIPRITQSQRAMNVASHGVDKTVNC